MVPVGAIWSAPRPDITPAWRHQSTGSRAHSATLPASRNWESPWAAVSGEPACRQRMAANSCRVTGRSGAKVPSPAPERQPSSAAQVTALEYSPDTSEKGQAPETAGRPAAS